MKQSRAFAGLGVMAALALASPVTGQEASPPAVATVPAPTSNSSADSIGPAQLRDFSLNGTVTRQAPQPAEPQPATAAPPSSSVARAERPPSASAVTSAGERAPSASRPVQPDAGTPAAPAMSASALDLPPPTPAEDLAPASALLDPLPAPATDLGADSGFAMTGGLSVLPWLLAALLAGLGLWFFAGRQRGRYALAGGPDEGLAFAAPEPAPRPAPRPAPEARAPVPPSDGGIVTTRLRPWLDLELIPGRAIFGEAGMTIEFELVVRNTGAAPARDVLIEAAMFNAGPDQDQQLGAFIAHPQTQGDRLAQILPMQQVSLKSAVTLSLAAMRQFEVGGRKLFVPLLGVNTVYRWSSGQGQTSASYLIGRDGKGEKMAPLRLDLGPRLFRGLGAREHSTRLRK